MFGNCYFIWSAKITPGPGPEMKICARERERHLLGPEDGGVQEIIERVLRQLPPPAGTVYTKDIKKTISSITRTQMALLRGSFQFKSLSNLPYFDSILQNSVQLCIYD